MSQIIIILHTRLFVQRVMNLQSIDGQIQSFRTRIVQSLKLQYIEDTAIRQQQQLSNWLFEEMEKIKKNRENELNSSKGIFDKKFFMGVVNKIVNKAEEGARQSFENDVKNLGQLIRKKYIPKNFTFESKLVPSEIMSVVNQLKEKKWQNYYGEVQGPLMNNLFILKKQNFHSAIQQVKTNGLKLMMIEEKVAHKYQRNLIQQLFGRIFRAKGSLSMVIKVKVNHDPLQPPYNLFCYIQDRQIFDQDFKQNGVNRGLEDIKIKSGQLGLQCQNGFTNINQLSLLQIILSEILVLPVQSLVSEFIVRKTKTSSQDNTELQLIKCNQQRHEQVLKQINLRQHPSLRNPLLYFNSYLKEHSISINEAEKICSNRQLYACFYRCLQIVMKILLTDFETEVDQQKINSSVCFNVDVFRALWAVFHKIGMISAWMKEVILPVKKGITIAEIIGHFCPIFNQISSTYTMAQSFKIYRDFYQNVQMESYLGNIVSKKSLQRYKDIFLSQSQIIKTKRFTTSLQNYTQIFQPVLQSCNIQYLTSIEASYILYFACKYRFKYHPISSDVQPSWKEDKLWQKCIIYLKQQADNQKGPLPFIDIGFDILGYICGVDVYLRDSSCFQRVSNVDQTQQALIGVSWFVDFIRHKYELNSEIILSSLLEKSFKHKKFKICRKLLEKNVRIRNFKQIIKFHDIINQMDQESRQKLVKTIQQDSSQMHRLFKWQQLMFVTLQKSSNQTIEIETLDFGKIYLPLDLLKSNIKDGRVINNLSRKDHKFNSNREIALIQYKNSHGKDISFYIESSQYPILPYFYKAFLNQIGTPQIMPYFTCFFFQNKIYRIIQNLKDSLNYLNGLGSFKQEQLNALTDQSLISEAILVSIIVPPAQIEARDLTICPSKATRDKIFIVDWHSHYCKDFISKYSGKTQLNSKNSLFLLQKMNKSIDKKVIIKYSNLEIQKVYENVFIQCKKINQRVTELRDRHYKDQYHSSNSQLLALLFQQKFAFILVERMNKIKRALSKKDGIYEKGMSYHRLLEAVNSQISYLYQQIFISNESILTRCDVLFNEDWTRAFLHNSLIEFYGSLSRLDQKDFVFPLHYQKFCFEGPTQNLVDVATNMIKLEAFKIGSIPQNLQQFSNQIFEYYMRNCDISHLQASKRQKLSQIIKSRSRQHLQQKEKRVLPLSFVCIKSMEFIKDKKLANDVSFERVQELIIQNCKFSEYQLNYFPKTIQNILYLQLKQITGLKYIGQNVMYGKSIQIKHLKNLSIIDCHDLVSIDLKCDILQNVELRNNKCLQSIFMFSLNLKNMSIFNNPNISFENIGLYIIKGINILVCKLSCHGDLMKLYSEQYQSYVTNVMRYLIIKFFESSESRYAILLALHKLKEVEESLLAMSGISNIKGVSSIFKNFTIDIEDKILIEMFRIYLSNPFLRKLSISDLLKSIQFQQSLSNQNLGLQRLYKLLNESLIKSAQSKTTCEIKYENTKFIFSSISLENIKTLIDRLRLDKNFSLVIQNMREQVEKEIIEQESKKIVTKQIDTIRYISIEKNELEKMSITMNNSLVKYSFLDRIFAGTISIEEMVKLQQINGPKSPLLRSKYYSSRLTLKQTQQKKFIKITSINIQNCTITNDRIIDPVILESQIKSAEYQLQKLQTEVKPISEQLKIEQIITSKIKTKQNGVCFGSVRNCKLQNCILDSFEIIHSMPFLNSLSIYKCQLQIPINNLSAIKLKSSIKGQQNGNKNIRKAYLKLFQILTKLELQTLDIQNFFNTSDAKSQQISLFDEFCQTLTKMSKLKKLKLNKNTFSTQNLQKLDETLNSTSIEELELLSINLTLNSSKVLRDEAEIQQTKANQYFEKLFQSTQNLKSLTIELNSKSIIQSLISSISQNKSLIQLKLITICQIQSSILQPLNKNTTLSIMSSNTQLPVWLLNHVISNGKRISAIKSMIKKVDSEESKEEKDAIQQQEALNTTISLGSMNSFRGSDFYKLGLSLDGGGVRGMLLATELNYLSSRVGYPLHKIFDCIGGTSIGGILALASAGTLDGENPIANTEELMNLFTKYGKDIFKKSQIMQLRNLFDTKYSAQSFEGVLKNYFKDSRLSNCLPQTNVIVTAVNRVDNKDYIFRSTEALLNRDRDFYMRDAARATSAAPTYFPSAQIKNVNASIKLSLVDGGVGMNNPSKLVIDEIKKIATNSGSTDNYFMLSLGTGKLPSEVIPEYAGLKDLAPIIDSFTQSSAYFVERDLATNYKGHFFRVSPLINVKDKKEAQLDNTSEIIVEMYRKTGMQAARKYFENTIIFGKYRNMNLIQWLRENTARKYEY